MTYNLSHKSLPVEEFAFPFYLEASITEDDIGKTVALDTSAANTVKLTTAGSVVLGVLDSFENRTEESVRVGTVQMKGGFEVTWTGTGNAIPSVGHGLVGSATKGVPTGSTAAAAAGQPLVVKVNTVAKTAEIILR